MGNTIANFKTPENLLSSDSDQSEEEHQINNHIIKSRVCMHTESSVHAHRVECACSQSRVCIDG